jgi:type IV secretory pathway TraG/TraD family ATPase VirD4
MIQTIQFYLMRAFLYSLQWGAIIGGVMIVLAAIRHDYRQRKKLQNLTRRFPFNASGIVFGKTPWLLVCSPEESEGSVFVTGGSGSGKTTAILIPTLQNFCGSAFVIDISGDIEKAVKTPRKLVYNPENSDTVPYNPFAAIDATATIEDKNENLQQLSFVLIPSARSDSDVTVYYKGEARKLLQAALIGYYHAGLDFIPICKKIVALPYETLIADLSASENELAVRLVSGFKGINDRLLASIKSELDNSIMLFATNKNMERTIRRGSYAVSPQAIEEHSIYIVIDDIKLHLYAPILRLLTAQMLTHLAGRENGKGKNVLLCLDEFASLGKMDMLPALRKLRKKRTRTMLLTQSLADIDLIYGKDERRAMMDNFPYKVVLAATEYDTQEYFSKLAGEKTIYTEYGSPLQKRRIYPEEFGQLKDNLILFHPGGVTQLRKNYYFKKWIF